MVFCGWFRDVSKKWTEARSFEAPQNAEKQGMADIRRSSPDTPTWVQRVEKLFAPLSGFQIF
ncbi:MAG: hypothetical protein EGQ09_21020 [Clostridiales bacterium]|nr:hypothetical protein [Clostridiales bacterium]MBD9199482.1 hypothetical protein [Clostridiales bacterium]